MGMKDKMLDKLVDVVPRNLDDPDAEVLQGLGPNELRNIAEHCRAKGLKVPTEIETLLPEKAKH
jgi:hypothetical protein